MALDRGHDRWIDEGEGDFIRFITQYPDSPEARAHNEELYSRLREQAHRSKELSRDDIGSPEWRMASGIFWSKARTEARKQLTDVASEMGVRPDVLRFMDAGLIREPELLGGLLERYAQALGRPELLRDYAERLQNPNWQERSGFKMPNYDAFAFASEPLIEGRDIRGFVRAAAVGAVVGLAGVAVRSIARRVIG